MIDKSLATNLLALLVVFAGLLITGEYRDLVLNTGLFALSGAFTNWLAVHMLFEKIPGFYGSGVIPARFEEFKTGIKTLVMDQFFTKENISSFVSNIAINGDEPAQENAFATIIEAVDFNAAFDSLVDVIMNSSFSGMISMFGGANALSSLKQPFEEKMREVLVTAGEDQEILAQIREHATENLLTRVEQIVDQRLDELSPQMVKEIIQQMIRKHLGWLVVWGGVIGGLIGLVSTLVLF